MKNESEVDREKQRISFYPSKTKNIMLLIISLIFIGGASLIGFAAWRIGDFVACVVVLLLDLVFGVLAIRLLKGIFSTKPYIVITEEELVIEASSKVPISIKWDDIKGFNSVEFNFNKSIEVLVYDQDKYHRLMMERMRKLNKMKFPIGFSSFGISWGQIKKGERDLFVRAMDERVKVLGFGHHSLTELMNEEMIGRKQYSEINWNYFKKSYAHSMLIALFTGVLFYFLNELDEYMALIIVSFILYPFARVIYDLLFGFWFGYKLERQKFATFYFRQFHYLLNWVVYLFSFIIAPFGVLYLILRSVYKFLKKQ